MKNKTKKIMAIILLVLTLCSSLPISSFATFITDINSNATFGVISGSLSAYGHELHYANYDGGTYILFCTQYGKTSPTGKEYTYNGEFIAQYKNNRPEYEKIAEKLPEIDKLINETAIGWDTQRMGKVELTIIRLAVYEIRFDETVPTGVAINEAVELAKKFGQEGSSGFVNGILAKFA